MRFFVGTSGYSYKEWKGSFYPEKLPQKEMLAYYAGRFSTVEANNTFYAMPTPALLESWSAQTPPTFRFVLKAPQAITHRKRLKNAEEETDRFLAVAATLGGRLGPLLFQLPPNLKKDLPRLDAFLAHLAKRTPAALEFRHESWLDDETTDCLRRHACALCVADADDLPAVDLADTAGWGYLRLRRESYTDAELRGWIKKIRATGWTEAYVFFRHEDTGTGPKLATRFLELTAE